MVMARKLTAILYDETPCHIGMLSIKLVIAKQS